MESKILFNEKKNISPVFKWAGGKRQLLSALSPLFPERFETYCEPFLGGGAVLFSLLPEKAYVNDINGELMEAYKVIRDNPDDLIAELKTYKNTSEFFYQIRGLDRNPETYRCLTAVQKAARMLYLNHTCFNGIYRVNKSGQFNVPFADYKKPDIVNEKRLHGVSQYFQQADIHFFSGDYEKVLNKLPAGDGTFVYLDPPYDPVSDTAYFTDYSKGGFSKEDQIRLRKCCDSLNQRGIRFLLSNSATDFIRGQYADYNITIVKAGRCINAVGSGRGKIDEVAVRNYG